jgi:hypothetical protein
MLCDVANLILGAFLLLSPWIVGYSGQPAQNASSVAWSLRACRLLRWLPSPNGDG